MASSLDPPIELRCSVLQAGAPAYAIGSRADRNCLAVAKLGALRRPCAAGRAAAQWRNRHDHLVTGLQTLAGPSLARERARSRAFEVPDRGAAVLPFDLQQDEGVGARVLELLHGACELDLMVVVEHRKGVVRGRCPNHRDQRSARQDDGEWLSHDRSLMYQDQVFRAATRGILSHLCRRKSALADLRI